MSESYVTLDVKNAVGTITFYTPNHNALPTEILKKLERTIIEAGSRSDLRVLVIQSGGDRTFCAGASFNTTRTYSLNYVLSPLKMQHQAQSMS